MIKYLFVALIVWRVYSAIRKAAREQADRSAGVEKLRRSSGLQEVSLGAVIEPPTQFSTASSGNRLDFPNTGSDSLAVGGSQRMGDNERWANLQADAAAFLNRDRTNSSADTLSFGDQSVDSEDGSRDLSPAFAQSSLPNPPSLQERQSLPDLQAAYLQTEVARRGIGFDRPSLRTYIMAREILGPPRVRARYRPGFRK